MGSASGNHGGARSLRGNVEPADAVPLVPRHGHGDAGRRVHPCPSPRRRARSGPAVRRCHGRRVVLAAAGGTGRTAAGPKLVGRRHRSGGRDLRGRHGPCHQRGSLPSRGRRRRCTRRDVALRGRRPLRLAGGRELAPRRGRREVPHVAGLGRLARPCRHAQLLEPRPGLSAAARLSLVRVRHRPRHLPGSECGRAGRGRRAGGRDRRHRRRAAPQADLRRQPADRGSLRPRHRRRPDDQARPTRLPAALCLRGPRPVARPAGTALFHRRQPGGHPGRRRSLRSRDLRPRAPLRSGNRALRGARDLAFARDPRHRRGAVPSRYRGCATSATTPATSTASPSTAPTGRPGAMSAASMSIPRPGGAGCSRCLPGATRPMS
jgi:hypothetical protein